MSRVDGGGLLGAERHRPDGTVGGEERRPGPVELEEEQSVAPEDRTLAADRGVEVDSVSAARNDPNCASGRASSRSCRATSPGKGRGQGHLAPGRGRERVPEERFTAQDRSLERTEEAAARPALDLDARRMADQRAGLGSDGLARTEQELEERERRSGGDDFLHTGRLRLPTPRLRGLRPSAVRAN